MYPLFQCLALDNILTICEVRRVPPPARAPLTPRRSRSRRPGACSSSRATRRCSASPSRRSSTSSSCVAGAASPSPSSIRATPRSISTCVSSAPERRVLTSVSPGSGAVDHRPGHRGEARRQTVARGVHLRSVRAAPFCESSLTPCAQGHQPRVSAPVPPPAPLLTSLAGPALPRRKAPCPSSSSANDTARSCSARSTPTSTRTTPSRPSSRRPSPRGASARCARSKPSAAPRRPSSPRASSPPSGGARARSSRRSTRCSSTRCALALHPPALSL